MAFIKPTANFKMDKQIKSSLHILDPHKRGEIKRMMIQAQLQGEIQVKRDKRPSGPRLTTDDAPSE